MSRNLAMPAIHFAGLDLLRFAAAVAVMLFHFTVLAWAMPDSTAYRMSGMSGCSHAAFPELAPWTTVGWVGVQVFFVISGFVIAFSAEGASLITFIRSRLLRLLPAAWVCASVTGITRGGSLGDYARSLWLSPFGPWVDPVYWTLGIELSFYGLVALLIACGGNERLHWLAWLLGATSAAYWLAFWLTQGNGHIDGAATGRWFIEHQEDRRLQLLLLPHGSFFALGIYLWRYFRRAAGPGVQLMCLLLAVVCVLQIVAHNDLAVAKTGIPARAAYAVGLWSAAMAFIVAALGWRGAIGPRLQGMLRQVGLMTYPLYLVHQVLGCLLLGVLTVLGVGRWIALSAVVMAMLGLSLIVSAGIEPLLRRRLAQALNALAATMSQGRLRQSMAREKSP